MKSIPRLIGLLACLLPTAVEAGRSCSFGGVVSVAFGSYNVFSATALDSAGSVTYTCSGFAGGDPLRIDFSRGGAPSYNPRRLSKTGGTLNYNLYTDAARSIIWGDASGGTSNYALTGTGNNATITLNIYGRIPALQNAAVGAYTDTITMTMDF